MNGKAVIFFCNWSSYPGLQLTENLLESSSDTPDKKLMVSMCSGRVSTELIVQAFHKGASGVMVTACPVDKCEHDGNYRTVARISLLKNILLQLGYDPNRLKLEWIDKGEAGKLDQAINTFMAEIDQFGPLPTH
jgi:coenzyme F420-reducing hydrogenase delta subunit